MSQFDKKRRQGLAQSHATHSEFARENKRTKRKLYRNHVFGLKKKDKVFIPLNY